MIHIHQYYLLKQVYALLPTGFVDLERKTHDEHTVAIMQKAPG